MEDKLLKYIEVSNYFKNKIGNEEIVPGQKLPTEFEMVELFSVSRHTVRQAILELEKDGYIYREKGRGAFCSNISREKNKKPKIVMVITTYLSAYIFPHIIRGIESTLSKNGYDVLLLTTNNKKEIEAEHLTKLFNYNVVGAIIEPTASATKNTNYEYYQKLNKKGIPYVMINAVYDNLEASHVVMDDEKVGYTLGKYIVDIGHKDVSGIFKEDDIQGRNRKKGYEKALKELGISLSQFPSGSFKTFEEEFYPYAFAKNLLSHTQRPTAIVCYNDKIALQVLNAARDLNLKVPEDLSVIGCDNDETIASIIEGGITTINHPKENLGKKAAEVLIEIINGNKKKIEYYYEPQLIIKNSTRLKE